MKIIGGLALLVAAACAAGVVVGMVFIEVERRIDEHCGRT